MKTTDAFGFVTIQDRSSKSNTFDSSDGSQLEVNNKSDIVEDINNNIPEKFPISYILYNLGNKLFLSQKYEKLYYSLKDSISSKLHSLRLKLHTNSLALTSLESLKIKFAMYLKIIEDKKISEFSIQESDIKIFSKYAKANKRFEDWYSSTKSLFPAANFEDRNECIEQNIKHYIDENHSLKEKIKDLESIQELRTKFFTILKSAYCFVPKLLTPTFYAQCTQLLGDISIHDCTNKFVMARDSLISGNLSAISDQWYKCFFELFSITPNYYKKDKKTLNKDTLDKLITQIGNVIGRKPSADEIKKYIDVHQKALQEDKMYQEAKVDDKDSYLVQKITKFVHENFDNIYNVLSINNSLSLDSEYKKCIDEQPFLLQVRLHRKVLRDVNKFVLLMGDQGKRNIGPGSNTTVKITQGGTATLHQGEFEAYADIAKNFKTTLKNFSNYMCSIDARNVLEQEKEFEELFQIEVIRSSAALLTHPFFFELCDKEFQLLKGKKYSFDLIHEQLPMAMIGAVGGAIYLEDQFKSMLKPRLLYDYRTTGSEKAAIALDTLNCKVFFDWLSMQINIHKLQEQLNNIIDIVNGHTVIFIDSETSIDWHIKIIDINDLELKCSDGYKLIFTRKGRFKLSNIIDSYIDKLETSITAHKDKKSKSEEISDTINKYIQSTQKFDGCNIRGDDLNHICIFDESNNSLIYKFGIEYNDTAIIITALNNSAENHFILERITSVPTSVIDRLTKKWYQVELFTSCSKTLKLKAEAEPKDKSDKGDEDYLMIVNHELSSVNSEFIKNNSDLQFGYDYNLIGNDFLPISIMATC